MEGDEFCFFESGEVESLVDAGRRTLAVNSKKRTPHWAHGGAGTGAFYIPPPAKMNYRWIAPAETITIHDYSIHGGMFYYGTSMELIDGSTEASLVNPELSVESAITPPDPPETLDYALWTPAARNGYLAWLAGGRRGVPAEARYILLFMTGLERRLIEDGARGLVSGEERLALRDEVKRLAALYASDKEAGAALARLRHYVEALPDAYTDAYKCEAPCDDYPFTLYENEKSIKKSAVAQQQYDAFKQCFIDYFHKHYQFKPKVRLVQRTLIYKPISPAVRAVHRSYRAYQIVVDDKLRGALEAAARYCGEALVWKPNRQKLNQLRKETGEVSRLLNALFVDDAPAPAPQSAAPSAFVLDAQHKAFLCELLRKDRWTRDEAAACAARFRLSLDGATETINEQSFDRLGEALIDDEDAHLTIHRETLIVG